VDVVFKATLQPLFFYAPAVYRLLAQAAPRHVPEFLAAEVLGGPTFTDTRARAGWAPHVASAQQGRLYALFRPFSGPRVAQSDRPEAAAEMARTAARIQAAVAALPAAARDGVPRVPVESVPEQYEEVLQRIRDYYLPRWLAGKGHFPAEHGDPRAAFATMQGLAAKVERWTAELAAGGWPESIDHTDLHTSNGVLHEDGSVLIFDWEEAVISCPFFSIEELTSRCGGRAAEVQAAYAEALPWGTRRERERAVDLGMWLSPITRAHYFEVFHEEFGFPDRSDRGAAMLARHALGGWTCRE
jgi:hypothetical protein